jgi:hypothetical protein
MAPLRLPLPPLTASPSDVRIYFAFILSELNLIPESEIAELVKRWKYGTGAEVRRLELVAYCKIFGGEIGSLPFRSM